LVTRSEYRRIDRRKDTENNPIKKNNLPEWLYDYLP
jgi:hypothetical protein